MIVKILRVLNLLFVSACVATLVALVILATYYSHAWQLNREKLVRILAVAQGIDLNALQGHDPHERAEPSVEQLSYEQILEARAVKNANLDLREQALRSAAQQFQTDQQKLADEKKRLLQLREGFQNELLALRNGATAAGREDVRRTLETLKPKQAKELLAQMLEKKEIDEVVALMAGMTDAKRAKIIAEFKTPAEVEQLDEILRRIRQGLPSAAMAENTQKRLEPPQGPGL